MHATTFRIGIPKAFCEDPGLEAGQQFVFVAKKADTGNVRDRMERTR